MLVSVKVDLTFPFLMNMLDRIVINGYLSFLTRENNVVYFFRDVRVSPCSPRNSCASEPKITSAGGNYATRTASHPMAERDVRKKDWLAPSCHRNRKPAALASISSSAAWAGPFAIPPPKFPTKDPTTASCANSAVVTPTTISTFSIRSPGVPLVEITEA